MNNRIEDKIRKIAEPLAKQTIEDAHGQCVSVSEKIAASLNQAGIPAWHISCGFYWATSTEMTYDVYLEFAIWLDKNPYKYPNGRINVSHDWVETTNFIVDGTAAQFTGGEPLRITNLNDKRYDKNSEHRTLV
jgi:hypothetical protein